MYYKSDKSKSGNGSDERPHNDDYNRQNRHQQQYDEVDLRLIDVLMSGHSVRESAVILDKPLSTIQRRARLLVQRGALRPTYELGYSELKIKRGFLHVYLESGRVDSTIDSLLKRDGIYSAGAHLGNSDIVAFFVFKDSREVLDLIEHVKDMEGVERVVWSEEIYAKTTNPKLESVLGGDGRAPMVQRERERERERKYPDLGSLGFSAGSYSISSRLA